MLLNSWNHYCFFCIVKYIIFISIIFNSLVSQAQVLDNRKGLAFTDKPFFNVDFIKKNKLKKLKGTFTYKKQGEMMRPTEYKYVYEFNRSGQLISTFETRTDDGTLDTTWNKYFYDDKKFSPILGFDGLVGLEYRANEIPFIFGANYKPFMEFSTRG